MKKVFSLLLLITLLLPICTAFATEETNEPITIRITWWGDTVRNEKYNNFCDAFELEYPWITVEREPNAWAGYWDKLATQVAGGNAPDVMGMHTQWAADYTGRNALLNLDPYIVDSTIETESISQAVYNTGLYNDSVYMVSMGLTVHALFINKSLCDEVGVELPSEINNDFWTWDEFANKAIEFRQKALAKNMDVYFVDEFTTIQSFQNFARSSEYDLYTNNGEVGFSAECLEAWLTYWKNLRDADAIPDAAMTTEGKSLTLEQGFFGSGKVAVVTLPANQYYLYVNAVPDSELVCKSLPTSEEGVLGVFVVGAHWAASSAIDETHQRAAALLINYIVNREGAAQFMQMDQGVPANKKMAEYIYPLLSKADQTALQFIQDTIGRITLPAAPFPPIGATAVTNLFNDTREQVAYGSLSPADAAKMFIESANEVLTDLKK